MFKLLQTPLREFLRLKSCRRVVAGLGENQRRDAAPVLLPGSVEAGRVPNHQPLHRFYSIRRRRAEGLDVPSCTATVDPEQEEEFVFLDCEPDEVQDQQDLDLLLKQIQMNPSTTGLKGKLSSAVADKQQHRALERQVKSLNATQEVDPGSFIEFQDVDFPLDESLLAAKGKKKKKKGQGQHKIYGTPDVDEPVSDTCCSGCGAVLHCVAADAAGYLPSEKFKALREEERLKNATCQRCYLLTHHQKALTVKMSKEEYRDVVRRIKPEKALVLLLVDLLDVPDSIVPDLLALVGKNKRIVILGNKVDLLPGDAPNYLQRIKRQLSQYCADAGIGDNVKDVHLISAKTGYGIENLISSLQRLWQYKGDVYLVGTANAGKSTLFNTLLESDYCKAKASDVIHKATISPWPGTTLNLLKFPIINPTPYRMSRRLERLKEASRQTEDQISPDELKRLQHFRKQGYVVGRVGRTFRMETGSRSNVIQFDPDSLAYGESPAGEEVGGASSPSTEPEFSYNELKDARWLFDTPGIMKENDVLSLLTESEVKLLVPSQAIVPRTFVLKPGTSLFLGALGRIDYLQGEKSCWFTVVASNRLPVHLTSTDNADAVYQKHAGHALLGVPAGGEDRMKEFPALVPQEFRLEGQGYLQATADVKLSSAGWVAVTGVAGNQLVLRVHSPEAAGFCLREPPLLPYINALKGERIKNSSTYRVKKPPALLDGSLQAKKKKRR
ncbi:nitric oxide-associated protein 1-like [Diretmus argenteus]